MVKCWVASREIKKIGRASAPDVPLMFRPPRFSVEQHSHVRTSSQLRDCSVRDAQARLPSESDGAEWSVAVHWSRAVSMQLSNTGIPCLIALGLVVLRTYHIIYKLKFLDNPVSSEAWCHFPTAFAHFVSLSLFGNSCNISHFFIIFIFVMVICDQWSFILLLQLFWGTMNCTHIT